MPMGVHKCAVQRRRCHSGNTGNRHSLKHANGPLHAPASGNRGHGGALPQGAGSSKQPVRCMHCWPLRMPASASASKQQQHSNNTVPKQWGQ
jgi:hypothetical protein